MHNRKGMAKIATLSVLSWWRWQHIDSDGAPAWSWPRTL